MCENGEIFDCQENKSNEVLDESCKGILMFNSDTSSSCFCRGSNDQKRNSDNILRKGWSKYTRYCSMAHVIDLTESLIIANENVDQNVQLE